MSNQGEYPEDNRVGKHEPHDLSLTRRDLIKVSAATAATAVVYPHSTLAASVPAATPAPEIMPPDTEGERQKPSSLRWIPEPRYWTLCVKICI